VPIRRRLCAAASRASQPGSRRVLIPRACPQVLICGFLHPARTALSRWGAPHDVRSLRPPSRAQHARGTRSTHVERKPFESAASDSRGTPAVPFGGPSRPDTRSWCSPRAAGSPSALEATEQTAIANAKRSSAGPADAIARAAFQGTGPADAIARAAFQRRAPGPTPRRRAPGSKADSRTPRLRGKRIRAAQPRADLARRATVAT
jgi:hypothetical protein